MNRVKGQTDYSCSSSNQTGEGSSISSFNGSAIAFFLGSFECQHAH